MKSEFIESQKFNQWWLWLLLIVPSIVIAVIVFFNSQAENEELPFSVIVVICTMPFLLVIFFWILNLRTTINENGIRAHFYPFATRNYRWDEIESAEVLNYGFVGGWGIRLFTKYGTVYNVRGKMGVFLRLKNGKKFLIGTQKPDELKEVLQHYLP